MDKEECMVALEQIILELPQYRKITNTLCNRYISDYVREEYEKEQIYTEGDYSSSKNYCWDIYDTIPISIIEAILDNFNQQEDTEEENTNLKQALIEIRKVINGEEFFLLMNSETNTHHSSKDKVICEDYFKGKELISKIIDKTLGDNNGNR